MSENTEHLKYLLIGLKYIFTTLSYISPLLKIYHTMVYNTSLNIYISTFYINRVN
jgi:hypothetical protein